MAIYRQVHISFWQDDFVLSLTPEEKYFYLYLMTNSKTTGYGIYEIPKQVMILETGYNAETIEKLLSKFIIYKKILYDDSTKEILIFNWLKFNPVNNYNAYQYVVKEIQLIKSETLIENFIKILSSYKGKWRGKKRIAKNEYVDTEFAEDLLMTLKEKKPLASPFPTKTQTNTQTQTQTNTQDPSFVFLFDEFRKLYPGTKYGLDTEFKNFKKHTDWKTVLPLLKSALLKQIAYREKLNSIPNAFVPNWKNLKTWISQRGWEEENPETISTAKPNTGSNKNSPIMDDILANGRKDVLNGI